MMDVVQPLGEFEAQFREILHKSLDKTSYVDVTSPGTVDTEFTVEHGLGYIPSGVDVISQDKAAITYKGTTVWDTNKIYLKTNVATVALRLRIY